MELRWGWNHSGRRDGVKRWVLHESEPVGGASGFGPVGHLKLAEDAREMKLHRREAHRERQLAERDAAADAYQDRDLVFADELGGAISPQRLTEAFGALRKRSGIRPGRLHDVRHSHATHLLTEGVPVHIVAARLGHSSPMVTLSVYAHVLPTSDERAAEVIAGVLG
jgi:integrase